MASHQIPVYLRKKEDEEAHVGKFAVTADVFTRLKFPIFMGTELKEEEEVEEEKHQHKPVRQRKATVRMYAQMWKAPEEEEPPLLLEDSATTQMRGLKEKGELKGWMVLVPSDRGLDAIRVEDWFAFKPVAPIKQPKLTLEEAMRLQRKKDRAHDKRTMFLDDAGLDSIDHVLLEAEREQKKKKKAWRKEKREAKQDYDEAASDDDGLEYEDSDSEEESDSEDEELRDATRELLAKGGKLVEDTILHGATSAAPSPAATAGTESVVTTPSASGQRKRKRESDDTGDRPKKKSKKERPTTQEEVMKILRRGPITPAALIRKFKKDRDLLFQIIKQVATKADIDGQPMIILKEETK